MYFSSTCPWLCNIWFDIVANWKVKQDQIHPLGITSAQVNALLRCNSINIFSFELTDGNTREILCRTAYGHFRFDELFTRLTMEPFAEKSIDSLASILFCTYRVRGEWRRVWGCVTQIQCNSSRSRNCRNRIKCRNRTQCFNLNEAHAPRLNSQFCNWKESSVKNDFNFFITGLSKDSYAMYSDCLAVYRF